MKKIYGVILVFFCLSFMFSCDNGETYADKLKRERKAIKRFLAEKNITVTHTFPEVFEENQFYYDSGSGIYFHVIDSGNGTRVQNGMKVFVRYRGGINLYASDTITPDSNTGEGLTQDYIDFTYGNTDTYIMNSSYADGYTYSNYLYKSSGMVVPLGFVGNQAKIKLLVPFSMGSGIQKSSYEPVYFDWLYYNFEIE